MLDDTAGLDDGNGFQVGFAIDPTDSFNQIAQLQSVMDEATMRVLADANKVEAATKGMVNLAGATASVTAFGGATSQVEQQATQSLKRIQSQGEALVGQLGRLNQNFGLNTDQIRANKIEAAALAAEQKGLTDLAERLRSGQAQYAAQQAAVAASTAAEAQALRDAAGAYGAFEAAAKRGIIAMKEAEAAERAQLVEQQAAELRAAAQAYQMFEAAARQGAAAMREADAAAKDQALAQQAQELREAAFAYGQFEAAARRGMQAMREADAVTKSAELAQRARDATIAASAEQRLADEHARLAAMVRGSHDAQEADAAAAERLREATDPLYAATKRLNAELAESTRLHIAGATADGEYARQQAVLTQRLRDAGTAHETMAVAGGKNAFAMKEVALQLPDVVQGLLSGQHPMQVFIQQGGQIVQIAMLAEGGIKGLALAIAAAMAPLAAVLVPVGVAIGGLYGAFKLFQGQVKSDGDLTRYRDGLGLTHAEMLKLGDGIDKAGDKIARLSSVTVTAGDVMTGLWKTIADNAGASAVGGVFEKIGGWAATAFHAVLDAWQATAGGITASIYGTFDLVRTVWGSFPAVFGDLFVSGVNAAIGALNRLVKAGVDQLNGVMALANKLPGVNLGKIAAPQIAALDNANAGAAAKAAQAIGAGYTKAYEDARKADAAFWNQVGINSRQNLKNRMKEQADAIKADRTPKKPHEDRHAEALARDAAAEEAQIRNLGLLAAAYGVSGAAALIAEAREKAESKAIKDRGDIEAETSRQIRLAIAQRVADAAKATAAMNDQAAVQEAANAQVAAGLLPQERAAQFVQQQIALLPLLAAQQAAQRIGDQKGIKDATDAIAAETAAQQRLNAAKVQGQFQADMTAGGNQLQQLQAELALIGATDAARARELATIQAEQQAKAKLYDPVQTAAYVAQQVAIADTQVQLEQGQAALNEKLQATATMWDTIAQAAQDAASGMSGAFGAVEDAVGGLVSTLAGLQGQEAKLANEERDRLRAVGDDYGAQQKIVAEYAAKIGNLQVKAYGDALSAAKGFFKQGSAGYKALETAEKAYRVYQLAVAISNAAREIGLIGGVSAAKLLASDKAITTDATATAAHIANAGAQASADGSAAVANAAKSVPFPANIAAVAAVASLLVGFGVSMLGGGGGAAAAAAYSKGNDGSGTVLGDSSAQSASIVNAIDQLKDVDTVMLSTSREMLSSLRSIDGEIGQLSTSLINAGNISGIVGVSNSNGGLFGTKKTIVGQGVYGGAQALGGVLDSGAYGTDYYADVEKKKKFLGITTGTKFSTQYAGDGSDIDQQFALILKGFAATVKAAAPELGVAADTVTQRLDSFVVDIGKVDLTGLKGDEITKKLEAVFSAEGDKIAAAVLPGFAKYQQAGEGLLQTITRVASTVETVTGELDKLGASTASLGVDAKMGIAGQFDSLSDFSSAADAYFETYYTDAEQAAAKTAQLGQVFSSLGLAMPATMDGFRDLVSGQDLTTAAGQRVYATLLQVAPAFADVVQAANGAKSAADVLSERVDLQKQLDEAMGNTAAIRAGELAQLDPSNRALQQRIYDLQDEQAATDAANKVAQERAGIQTTLLQLEGDTTAIRQQQLDALDPSNRALQQQVFALQDQQAAATAATAAAQAQAQADQAIAQQRSGLEDQINQLTGDTAAIRAKELASLDPSNRALQQRIYDLQDEQTATQAAAAASEAAASAAEAVAQQEAAVAQERQGLQQQLWELTGDTASLRAAQIASLDPSNRALQEQIYAIQDAQAAAKAAEDLASAWSTVGDSIKQEIDRIRGLTDASTGGGGFAQLQGRFNAAITAAMGGDQTAAQGLPDLSKSLLDAAASAATSRQELARIEAQTAAALQAVYGTINAGVTASNTATSAVLGTAANDAGAGSTSSADDWWDTFAATTAAQPAGDVANEIAQLRAEVAALHADNNKGHAATAANTGKTATMIDRAQRKGGGDSLSVKAA